MPCVLHFEGDHECIVKAKKLESTLATEAVDLQASKRRKVDSPVVKFDSIGELKETGDSAENWVQKGGIVLTTSDKQHILSGKKLNDLHINLAQTIYVETTVTCMN